VLDFGCGSGLFTRCLGDIIGPANIVGSDFHPQAPAEMRDRAYLPMDTLQTAAGSFDTVLAMHVLEHDDDSFALLNRIAGMVRPGGTIVLEVPNIDCFWTGVFGRSWDAWYLPFHRTHFSPPSLSALVKRGGLELAALHDVTVPTMGRSLANLMKKPNSLPFLVAGIALHPLQILGERLSDKPSALRIIARRPA
jgi:SAM-dependent methyltransferase